MDWDNNQENHQDSHQNQRECRNGINGTNVNVNGNGGTNMLYVKVMTDEQLETLRKQIAVYAAICEQLVEMHKTLSAQQDLAGGRLGNLYCDPLMASGGHKITARQRWTPTPVQLQILERIFDQGNGTPSKQKIKEITSELSQHGQISETNVYNWFQNRRARSKRKQSAILPNSGESEVETEIESFKEKKTKPEDSQPDEDATPVSDHMYLHSPDIGIDQLVGKMESPGNCIPYWQLEQYDLFG